MDRSRGRSRRRRRRRFRFREGESADRTCPSGARGNRLRPDRSGSTG